MNKKLTKKSLKKNKKGGSIYSHNYMRNLFKVDTNINDFIVLYAEEKKLLFFILDSFFNTKYNAIKKKLIKYIYNQKSDEKPYNSNNSRDIFETLQLPYFIMILFMHIHLYAKCQKIISILENEQNQKLKGIIKDFNNKMCQIITINKSNIESVIKYIKKIIFVTCLFNQMENVNNSLAYLLIVFDLFSLKEQLFNHNKKETHMFKFINKSEKNFDTIIKEIDSLVETYKQKIITKKSNNQSQKNQTISSKNKNINKNKNNLANQNNQKNNENKNWQLYEDMIIFVNSLGDGFLNTILKMEFDDFVNTSKNQNQSNENTQANNTGSSVDIKSFQMLCKQDFISKANEKFGNDLFQNNTIDSGKNDLNIKDILERNKPIITLNDILKTVKTLNVYDDHSLLNDLINFRIFDESIHVKYVDKSQRKDFYHKCFSSKISSLNPTLTISSLVIYNFDAKTVEFVFEGQLPENLYIFKKNFAKLIDTITKNSRKVNNYILIDTNTDKSDLFIPFTGFISNKNKKIFEERFNYILQNPKDILDFEDSYTSQAKGLYNMISTTKKMLQKSRNSRNYSKK